MLLRIEEQFGERLGTSKRCCRCVGLAVGVQIISVLALTSIANHTLTSIARTGAPCYFWWKRWATTLTFVVGHAIRLVTVPFAISGLIGARKGEERKLRKFFVCLLGLAACCMLDVVLCLFEVSEVCNSAELAEWSRCSHEWGKNQYQCVAIGGSLIDPRQPARCAAVQQQETQGETGAGTRDYDSCVAVRGCQHVPTPESERVVPACCTHEDWSHDNGPCSREPFERAAEYDATQCQIISDLYDVGLNLIWVVVLIWFAYVVNSYRAEITTGGHLASVGSSGARPHRARGEIELETVATVVSEGQGEKSY